MTASNSTNPKDKIGRTKPPLHLIPPTATIEEAVVMGLGAKKYGPFNWRSHSVAASVYIGACKRHLESWYDGESRDPESGASHLAHARACLGILLDAEANSMLVDDRPPTGRAADLIKEFTTAWSAASREHDEDAAVEAAATVSSEHHPACLCPGCADAAPATEAGELKWPAGFKVVDIELSPMRTVPRPRRVYIAGPMRGHKDFNFPAFDKARDHFADAGWEVISPADMDREHGDQDLTAEQAETHEVQSRMVRRDVDALLSFDPGNGDAVAMLPGWEQSRGAAAEFFVARWLGLRVLDAKTRQPLARTFGTELTKVADAYLSDQETT